jgi:hypothetical protein
VSIPGTGGLPTRRPDQTRNPPPSGTQPGSSAGIVRARLVIVSGAAGGVFVYNGTPGPGNPPILSATSGTTDPYGNVVIPVLQIQGGGLLTVGTATGADVVLASNINLPITTNIAATGSPAANVTSFGNLQQVIELPSHNAAETSPPIIGQTLITYTNGEVADAVLILGGIANSTGLGTFQLQLSESSAGTYAAGCIRGSYNIAAGKFVLQPSIWEPSTFAGVSFQTIYYYQGTVGPSVAMGGLTSGNLVPGSAENWHSLAAGNSWTGTVYYKLTEDYEVYLWSNNLTAPAAAANGVTIVTVPAAYSPNIVSMTFMVGALNNAGVVPRLTLATTGTIQATGVAASSGVTLDMRVPLDLP